jgi:hypothetical protein
VLVLWVMNTLFRRKSPRDKHLAMTTVVLATFLCSPHADAKPPEVAVSVGAGPRFLTEPFGKDVKRGLGIDVGQEWRWTYVGIGAEIGAAYYLTTQEAPPISRGIQTYLFALGPRGFLPLGPLVFAVGIDYARFGILGNSLLRQTSPPDTAANPLAYHLVGFRSGVRYRWSGLELRLAGSYLPLFEVESAVVGVSLTLGITGGRP